VNAPFAVQSRDLTEVTAQPGLLQQSGTATVVPGTGAFFAQISTLQEIAAAPDAVQRLEAMVEALLEKEFEYAMTILDSDDTGIATNNLWFQPVPGIQHGPRIKVMLDPAFAVRPGGKQATVPFDPEKSAEGDIPPALEREVRAFIDLNRPALLKYWNLEYPSTKKFLAELKPLPKRRG
jgi:hypothetical protein